MNFRNRIFSLILPMFFFSLLMLFPEEKVYTVQRGETIFSIARSFGVDRDELMRVNGISDPAKLQAGQRLKIPGTGVPGTLVPGTNVPGASGSSGNRGESIYRVIRGDTFYGIARRFGLTVDQILTVNSLPSDYVLKEGDMLRIPETQGASSTGTPPQGSSTSSTSTENRTLNLSVSWPVAAREVTYAAGNTGGVIITGERAEPVKSLTNGTVISAGPYRNYGRVVIIQATGGYIYVYGGCEVLTVKEGDKVKPGMEMGKLGIDAITGKPQLFFRVYLNNNPVDPAKAPRA